jgi:Fe-S cluster assembly protein SufD
LNTVASPSPFLASVARGHATVAAALAAGSRESEVRQLALERFLAAGLPTGRDENWKYLGLRSLARREFSFAPVAAATERMPDGILALPGAARLVFVNGRFSPALSAPLPQSNGARIETLTEAYARNPNLLASALPEDDRADTRFALLNTAFVADGASIELDAGEAPLVYLVFVASGGAAAAASFTRLRIHAKRGASCVVVEHHIADGTGASFVNSLAEIAVDAGSHVELCRLHGLAAGTMQFDSLRARVGAGSTFAIHSLAVGGDIVRSDVDIELNGPAAATQLRGLLFTAGSQHHELHAEIRHAVPETTSRTEVRAVVNESGRAICNSKVIVAPGAKRSSSEQNFRNLLLAPAAEADTRPQLEIHNEDVKCSHGASTGRLDPNALFYLASRGLDAKTARGLLTYAFVIDLLKAVPVAELTQALAQRIAGALPERDLIKEFI